MPRQVVQIAIVRSCHNIVAISITLARRLYLVSRGSGDVNALFRNSLRDIYFHPQFAPDSMIYDILCKV